jgi:hypothetical protein
MEEARRREAKRAIEEALGDEPAAQPAPAAATPQSQRFPVSQPSPQYAHAAGAPPPQGAAPPDGSPQAGYRNSPTYSVSGSTGTRGTSQWEPNPQPPVSNQPPTPQQQPQYASGPNQPFTPNTHLNQSPQQQQQPPRQPPGGQPLSPFGGSQRQPDAASPPPAPRRQSVVSVPSNLGRRQSSVGGSVRGEGSRRDDGVTMSMLVDPYGERANNGRSQLNPQAIAATTHRLLHLDPSQFTQQDVVELLKVIEVSNRYGREIEHSVGEIAALLERKTLECEGLRRLASENHSTLASAVKSEYNSRVRMETKQGNEIRSLQTKIAAMRVEKDELQQEVESLRMMVRQLQSTPDPLNGREAGGDNLFNRLAGANSTGMVSGTGDGVSSWNMPRPAQLVTSQRNLVNLVGNMDGDVATKLHSSGVFDFLLVLCQRLCTPVPGKDDVYPEMGVVVGQVLQEMRAERGLVGGALGSPNVASGPNGAFVSPPNNTLAHQAATISVPLVKKSYRQRVIDLYLANNPEDYAKPSTIEDLHRLLEKWDGREDELYRKLLKEYKTRDPSGEFMNRVPTSSTVYNGGASPTSLTSDQVAAAVTPTPYSRQFNDGESVASDSELHLRVVLMYKKYNPEKLESKEFGELVRKYPPETLLKALVERYGPEPSLHERKRIVKAIEEGDTNY